jgi:hypothetical protein
MINQTIPDDDILLNEADFQEMFITNQPVLQLELKIGSNEIPRFSCACHKLNLAIRIT